MVCECYLAGEKLCLFNSHTDALKINYNVFTNDDKNVYIVYTTQVNSTFRARWLASSEVISQVLFTPEQPKRNKMASRFATVT